MDEIILDEGKFSTKEECIAWLASELNKRGIAEGIGDSSGAAVDAGTDANTGANVGANANANEGASASPSTGGSVESLAAAREPLRIVVHHCGLKPTEEVETFELIEHAAEGDTDAAATAAADGLCWFDQLSAQLEQYALNNPTLDVIVYFDDLDQDETDLDAHMSAADAIERLKQGNLSFLKARHNNGTIAADRVRELFEGGQRPYAVVVACSDSRVVPEHMFMAGLGELFVIRVAGNIVGPIELASAVYACEHLHSKLLLVLGHTHCGAIESAIHKAEADGYDESTAQGGTEQTGEAQLEDTHSASENFRTSSANPVLAITDTILKAIEEERDPYVASVLNVRNSMRKLEQCPQLIHLSENEGLEIHGAVYHTHSGVVDFLPKM